MNNRGQIFDEFISGLFILLGITLVFIVLQQVWVNTLYDQALENNVNPGNLTLVDKFYDLWSIPTVLAVVLGIAISGKIRRVPVANI